MTKDQALDLLLLLSSLETWSFQTSVSIPDHLHEALGENVGLLRDIVLPKNEEAQ
jgi:hypothetical protein